MVRPRERQFVELIKSHSDNYKMLSVTRHTQMESREVAAGDGGEKNYRILITYLHEYAYTMGSITTSIYELNVRFVRR